MTNRECERRLLDLLAEAWLIFQAYDPHGHGTHLTMFATADGHCVMGYKPSADGMKRIVDGYLSPYGDYRFSKSGRDDG